MIQLDTLRAELTFQLYINIEKITRQSRVMYFANS